MSEASKAARAAMRSKAKRMADGDPHAKVDASSWEPSEPLNTTTKTGARPIRPRIYKAGGKVQGDRTKPRGDKLPRQIAEAYANRNMPELNADEFGKGHTGAYKKGGRAHKDMGGSNVPAQRLAFGPVVKGTIGIKTGGKVKGKGTYFGGTRPTGGRMPRADGGKAEYSEAERGLREKHGDDKLIESYRTHQKNAARPKSYSGPLTAGSMRSNLGRKILEERGEEHNGGRAKRASGGRAKGKTNINILIGGGHGGQPQTPGAMPGPVRPPVPVPVAPPSGPPQGMPMPMAPQMPPQSMGGQMPPPQMRKNGGRIKGMPPKTATSFKDMRAGSGGGLGRLEKTAIAKKQYGSPP